jgi:hypothetical protein
MSRLQLDLINCILKNDKAGLNKLLIKIPVGERGIINRAIPFFEGKSILEIARDESKSGSRNSKAILETLENAINPNIIPSYHPADPISYNAIQQNYNILPSQPSKPSSLHLSGPYPLTTYEQLEQQNISPLIPTPRILGSKGGKRRTGKMRSDKIKKKSRKHLRR